MGANKFNIRKIIKDVILEQYDSEKLYKKEYVIGRLKTGPKELRKYIKTLPEINCIDSNGNPQICTKVPEVIYIYLTGRYL